MVAEGGRRTTKRTAAMVRRYIGAPLILFRRSNAALSTKRFDRVYSTSVPAASWLFETVVLVEESLRLQAETKRLMSEAGRLLGAAEAARGSWPELQQS